MLIIPSDAFPKASIEANLARMNKNKIEIKKRSTFSEKYGTIDSFNHIY